MLYLYYELDKWGNEHVYSTLCNSALNLRIPTTVYKLDDTEYYANVDY